MPRPMPEIPARAPAPQKNDDAAFLDDIAHAALDGPLPEAPDAKGSSSLRALLPSLPEQDIETVLASLRDTGTLGSILALVEDPGN